MKKNLIILLLFISVSTFSQLCDGISKMDFLKTINSLDSITIRKTSISMLMGYNLHKNGLPELGLSLYTFNCRPPHPASGYLYIGSEFNKERGQEWIYGPKVGFMITGGFAFGSSLIYYNNSKESSLRFRPEIGIGFGAFSITYGYNIPLLNKGFSDINRNNFSLKYNFEIYKLKETKISKRWKNKT
ncbi:hypothetical protein [Wenyingzhuangia sp. IMCC45467]